MPSKITNLLPEFLTDRERQAAAAMTKVLITGAANAAVFTPIDTSALLNSQYKKIDKRGDVITGYCGYTVSYASYVHDPEVKQVFRRATAKKSYLKLGFEEAKPILDRIVAKALKV